MAILLDTYCGYIYYRKWKRKTVNGLVAFYFCEIHDLFLHCRSSLSSVLTIHLKLPVLCFWLVHDFRFRLSQGYVLFTPPTLVWRSFKCIVALYSSRQNGMVRLDTLILFGLILSKCYYSSPISSLSIFDFWSRIACTFADHPWKILERSREDPGWIPDGFRKDHREISR